MFRIFLVSTYSFILFFVILFPSCRFRASCDDRLLLDSIFSFFSIFSLIVTHQLINIIGGIKSRKYDLLFLSTILFSFAFFGKDVNVHINVKSLSLFFGFFFLIMQTKKKIHDYLVDQGIFDESMNVLFIRRGVTIGSGKAPFFLFAYLLLMAWGFF